MVKDVIKAIRFNKKEIEKLKQKAKKKKRNLSDYMRCKILEDSDLEW